MKKLAVILLITLLPIVMFGQIENEKKFSNDSCYYELLISPNGTFQYYKATTYSSAPSKEWNDDIVEIDTRYAGTWLIRNDTLILADTTWPRENVNWKLCSALFIGDYQLKNINLPECNPNSILSLNYIHDQGNNSMYYGHFSTEGEFTGEKTIRNDKQKLILRLKYSNNVLIDTLFNNTNK
jgi:hypothetical protein